ncbi:hypothetical protein BVY02_00140 [bacterium J17]|nr:hypothetical protein BVY02_00140 [bacterium J17]
MKKVLLLNPPGKELYVRDYYCSKVSKADYLYHPTDLLVLSAWLDSYFELKVLDCIVDGLRESAAIATICSFAPDAVVFLTGSVSKAEDFPFMAKVAEATQALILGSGDCLLDEFDLTKEEAPWLRAAILDFTTDDTLLFLRNELLGESNSLTNIYDFKDGIRESGASRVKGKDFCIPVPRYELFPNGKYTYPFVRNRPFASVLTDYGCPYRCKFCVMTSLGFKYRPVANVLEELDYIQSLGFKEIYFVDQTFGYNKKRLRELCQAMINRGYDFSWVAFTRVDVIDDETLSLMKESGCHMLMFGVESPVQRVLDEQKKDLKLEQIEQGFRLCREHGVKTLATFIVGLPGTSYEENASILDFAVKIAPTYASFNVLIPRMGTETRELAKNKNWIVAEDGLMDQSGSFASMRTESLSADEIIALHRKIVRGFYFRPSYLFNRLMELRNYYQLRTAFRNAFALFRQSVLISS